MIQVNVSKKGSRIVDTSQGKVYTPKEWEEELAKRHGLKQENVEEDMEDNSDKELRKVGVQEDNDDE